MSDYKIPSIVILIISLLLGPIVSMARAGSIEAQLTSQEKQSLQREVRLVVDLLQNHHYTGRSFREIDNKTMVTRFLEELDPKADIFSADKIDFFHRRFDRTLKSVYLFRGDLQPAFEIFDQYIEQARTRMQWTQKRLERGFDFTLDENYAERADPVPLKSPAEADRQWELMLKDRVLVERLRGRDEAGAVAAVQKYFAEIERTIASYDSLAVRERFFDAIIRSYDPHSGYFSADSAREFALEMEKAVIGLGLDLRKENGRCVVARVHSGGSADLNSSIATGDIVLALASVDGPWIELTRLRLREIVGLMRGAVGTKLRLAYQAGGTELRSEVTLERTRLVLGEDRAHGAVSEVPDGTGKLRRIGWIDLPSFYTAGENSSLTSGARDVRELLGKMTITPLEGLVLDLRDNPGGALSEAIALSEIFLPEGVVMLSRGMDGKVKEHSMKPSDPLFRGPLVILISSSSASASEVFAGAMKFHRRAVVVGPGPSFGKGTMQAYIELAKTMGNEANDWGTLRLTAERFYQPNGKAVQSSGVSPDILFPNLPIPGGSQRESDLPGALAEDSVSAPASIKPVVTAGICEISIPLLSQLDQTAKGNFEKLPEWELVRLEQQLQAKAMARESRSLILENRTKTWIEQRTTFNEDRQKRRELTQRVSYSTLPYEIGAVESARASHEIKLKSLGTTNQQVLNRLQQGSFLVETDHGHLRKLRLDTIDFENFLGNATELAAAFTESTGRPTFAPEIETLLTKLSLLEHKTDAAVMRVATELSGADLDQASTRKGLEAMLAQIVQLDGNMLRERPGLDVPLRESLRLAAKWADLIESKNQP